MPDEVIEVNKIALMMMNRASEGRIRYGSTYKEKDMFKEVEEELADLFNYMIYEFVKIKERLNGLSKTDS